MPLRNHLACRFKLKELTETGRFSGLASVYGNVDLGSDVVEPGAFTKTLADHAGVFPILWQHDSRHPVGLGTFTDTPRGLQVEGQLTMEVSKAAEAYALMRDKVVRGLSIGYDTMKDSVVGGVRHLQELRLWETSIVTFPMNQLALVDGVKTAEEFEELVARMEEACEQMDFDRETSTQVLKSLRALRPLDAAAQKQQDAAPDLHALSDPIRSFADSIRWSS